VTDVVETVSLACYDELFNVDISTDIEASVSVLAVAS